MENHPDPDPQETQEWIESLEAVIELIEEQGMTYLAEAGPDAARNSAPRPDEGPKSPRF